MHLGGGRGESLWNPLQSVPCKIQEEVTAAGLTVPAPVHSVCFHAPSLTGSTRWQGGSSRLTCSLVQVQEQRELSRKMSRKSHGRERSTQTHGVMTCGLALRPECELQGNCGPQTGVMLKGEPGAEAGGGGMFAEEADTKYSPQPGSVTTSPWRLPGVFLSPNTNIS